LFSFAHFTTTSFTPSSSLFTQDGGESARALEAERAKSADLKSKVSELEKELATRFASSLSCAACSLMHTCSHSRTEALSARAAAVEAELHKSSSAHARDAGQVTLNGPTPITSCFPNLNCSSSLQAKELEAIKREKRQLERDNRENLELVERLQKEKFEILELYSQSQRACERLTKTVAELERKLAKVTCLLMLFALLRFQSCN
jgi:hypothetical protein